MRWLISAVLAAWSILTYPVFGGEPPEWQENALSALEQGDYETAGELAQDNSSRDPTKAGVILFGARAVEYERTHDTQTLSEARGFYNEIFDKITMEDALVLHRMRNIPGPYVYENAEALLNSAVSHVESPEQAAAAAAVLDVVYAKEKYQVCNSLAAWLKMEQEKAGKGKRLSDKEKEVFGNRDLILSLMDNLDLPVTYTEITSTVPRANPHKGTKSFDLYLTSPVPHSTRTLVTNATAKDCLLLMKDSAVPVLRSMQGELSDEGKNFLKTLESK